MECIGAGPYAAAVRLLATTLILLMTPPALGESIRLVGGGDTAWPTGWFHQQALKRKAEIFAGIAPYLAQADLRFLNLESPVTKRRATAKKKYPLVTPPPFAAVMVDAGFNLISLANNHTGDAGPEGLTDTLAAFSRLATDAAPLHFAGAGLTPTQRKKPALFTLKGQKVAFLAFRLSGSPLGNPMAKDAAERQIREAATLADVVIVSAHGGAEYKTVPGGWKSNRWRSFVDAGADVVLGHGPHNLQGVEWYKGAAIFYSLGNLSFGTRPPKRRTGGMILTAALARVDIDKGVVTRAAVIPLFVDNVQSWTVDGVKMPVRQFSPRPTTGPHFKAMTQQLIEMSSSIHNNGTRITPCDNALCFGPR